MKPGHSLSFVVVLPLLLAAWPVEGRVADRNPAPACEVVVKADPELLLVAQHTGIIVKQTGSSITFAPGYRYRTVSRGGKEIMTISSPDVAGTGGTVECFCFNVGQSQGSGGTCFPTQSGNTVTCKAHAGACNGTCNMTLVALPPPPPTN